MAKVTAMLELSKVERASLADRWAAKVDTKGGTKACWRWRGAQSKSRNGLRGIIRVKDKTLSAKRVGVALDTGASLMDPIVRTAPIVHKGKATVKECVNPKHNHFEAREQERRTSERRSGRAQSKKR